MEQARGVVWDFGDVSSFFLYYGEARVGSEVE